MLHRIAFPVVSQWCHKYVDLRRARDQRKRREEVGDLVVARDGLEEMPQKAGPVQACADEDEHEYPLAWHPFITSDRPELRR